MRLVSSDIEFVVDAGNQQTVGLRFANLAIPPGAAIVRASIELQVDEVSTGSAVLLIAAEAADDAATFGTAPGDLTNRSRTTAAVDWQPGEWLIVGSLQRTADFGPVVQEVVDRPGWASGNALVVIVSGTGRRVAESYDSTAPAAALLHVEFVTGP